jgi:hypothetical protein
MKHPAKHIGYVVSLMILSTAMVQARSACTTSDTGVSGCYRHVKTPPVYQVVTEKVMVRPAQVVERVIPAQTQTVTERVMVRPPLTVTRMVNSQHTQIDQPIMISPERREWKVTRDVHGRKTGCWVTIPARYGNRPQTVMISPPRVVNDELPAVYENRTRTITIKPAQVVQETVAPAVYQTRERRVMTQKASTLWAPVTTVNRAY